MKESQKLLLILGSHAHVPSGASEKEFECAYDNILRPFISNLYRYSNIQAVLHYSGVLLYWVERTHPEFFMLIEDMLARKQAEIIGGGFYEPMFPIIPNQDRIGQIELLTTYIRRHFGKRPQGCWIPAMAWEQNMAASLSASDMQYTFLSQEQFALSGIKGSGLYFPCITEDQGKLIAVFPVSKEIENELANKSFSQTFIEKKKILESQIGKKDENQNIIITIFPENIYKDPEEAHDKAWNRFFEEISLSENILETALPSKILKTCKDFIKTSFKNSASIKDYSPRMFLINHEEANAIYSKMIFTNVLISQLKGDKSRKQNAREELWKAQDSSLYLPGLEKNSVYRQAAYRCLLKAEQLTREKGKFISSLIQYDFDFDGKKEFLFQDARLNCYINIKGAKIFELDYLPKEWNYIECARPAFADAIYPLGDELTNPLRLCYKEQYEPLTQERKGKSCFRLPAVPEIEIEINKCYSLKKDSLLASYQLKNTGKEKRGFCFVPEINFSFAKDKDEHIRFYSVQGDKDIPVQKKLSGVNTLKILDVNNETQILLSSSSPFSGCLFFDDAARIMPQFNITLDAGKAWTNEFSLKFSH